MTRYGRLAAKTFSATVLGTAMMFNAGCEATKHTVAKVEEKFDHHKEAAIMGIKQSNFGKTPDGQQVDLYTLDNSHGMTAKIMTYGAIVTELHAPDKAGKTANVVLGFNNLDQYLAGHPFFGAIAGRYANRIANGKFTLDGKEYSLFVNNGPNSLHGGKVGFDKAVWKAEPIATADGPSLKLTYVSKDGEEGYPGTLTNTVTYTLTHKSELKIDYNSTTDKSTVLNLTVSPPQILRPGLITADEIEAVIGGVDRQPSPQTEASNGSESSAALSPGTSLRHYSPNTPLMWGDVDFAKNIVATGAKVAYMHHSPANEDDSLTFYKMSADPKGYATNLYSALHALDDGRFTNIVVEPLGEGEIWDAIRDRLNRATYSG